MRGKPELFAEHYAQATLFWNSQTPVERQHIIKAFRFELTRVQTPAVRKRVVALLANVASELAKGVAKGLGMEMPEPLPKAIKNPRKPEVSRSPALSLFARPGDGSIRTRRVAILVADGIEKEIIGKIHTALTEAGAVPRLVGIQLGKVQTREGSPLEVDVTLEAMPAVLYDALVVAGGAEPMKALGQVGHTAEFIKEQYRHCKPILAFDGGRDLVENAGVPSKLPSGEPDPGLLRFKDEAIEDVLPNLSPRLLSTVTLIGRQILRLCKACVNQIQGERFLSF